GVLSLLVQLSRAPVQALRHPPADGRQLPEPDRSREDEDVGGHHLLLNARPVVARPAVLPHVGIDARSDLVVHRTQHVHRDAVLAEDRRGHVDEPLGVGQLGRPLERAVQKERSQPLEIRGSRLAERRRTWFGHGPPRYGRAWTAPNSTAPRSGPPEISASRQSAWPPGAPGVRSNARLLWSRATPVHLSRASSVR